MDRLQEVSKQELFELLEAALDGIDGIESEMGPEELNQYWNVAKIDTARRLIDEVRDESNGERASVSV